ncbi:cytochrome-c oxidase, cbb3-type subunit I [Bacteriovorax stolpii]|uniref:cytochrome-c oxidase n=1 Tax=Bacteriovorax stolpii TaxID=960 RepID=A0A2K9NQH7_BACTC|nr:cytochrome-c oxidase, cbb3-type subunit I [Bacteriovorax stolpii]AUN97752.1 cytochrome C oxidase Cbb3 [Bacteriovorax stolpii]QDK42263.1 cytochrome-c oxidase, cbb3-type subunit I [Bacteriovorax stolpii]TDP51572.1 cytochrome c oxidase cbb3-type subunit I/II [Bacteriovorax stolpii]
MNAHVSTRTGKLEYFSYDDQIVRLFVIATVIWGAVALLLGVTIAFQLADWHVNLGLQWTTFGRLRPLHTNAAIFAFCGNAIFAGIYYSHQRLLKARLFNDTLSKIHFWGWQLIIVAAALTLPFGITTGKEYAELEWPIDIAITVIWVVFAVNFFGTIIRRRERHIYVAIWFYIATIITVAVLHIINSLEIPVSIGKSYSLYAGVQDALVQWWYGHNAVAFFLTTPFLGLMYYYVPKAANRPVYSYRLSIIHFWSLVFIYIWAGPHHLLYTTLPEWAQTLGMVFSVALWAPSWGGMINGLLTLRGVWDKVRTDPVLKFMALALTFYGMSTFEGPLLSIKSVNSIAHFTDWIPGHVHAGTIGWNYLLTAGVLYFLVPRLWNAEIYSKRLATIQFWTATIGIILYIVSMWIAGISQSLMWRAIDASGKLVYPNFIESVVKIVPMYWVRAIGGTFVLVSFVIMIYNLYKTAKSGSVGKEEVYEAYALDDSSIEQGAAPHRKLEGWPMIFAVLSLVAILVGTAIEIVPAVLSKQYITKLDVVKPYTPLELLGRDIYIREGCYLCHSQTVRPMAHEVLRYGKASEAAEFVYDHPFQWGSKRTGPDLARVGGKYPNMWHYRHMWDPREVTAGSIMPRYTWLFDQKTDYGSLPKKMQVMQTLGVPYSQAEIDASVANAQAQAQSIRDNLVEAGVPEKVLDKEIIPLIAYLQRIGVDYGKSEVQQ